ncbi:MAG: FHA domain-containing protein [Firmicutes bacterium]|nr:FHA domain-containing protein [Bacillota bacterium]
MPFGECANHHTYNLNKYGDTCPFCGALNIKLTDRGRTPEELKVLYELPKNQYTCGWLICIKGINKGRSYPIRPGKNLIGSGDRMDIQILGDRKVDFYYHAALIFDPKNQIALLLPGESRGLIYLESDALFVPTKLENYAEIGIGKSIFKYVPFCGDKHSWSEAPVQPKLEPS